jgi:hypothetical protein
MVDRILSDLLEVGFVIAHIFEYIAQWLFYKRL